MESAQRELLVPIYVILKRLSGTLAFSWTSRITQALGLAVLG